MKIGFISHTGTLGGAEYTLLELIDGLAKQQISCYVITQRKGKLTKALKARGIPFAVIPFVWWTIPDNSRIYFLIKYFSFFISSILSTALIAKRLRSWKVDAVYTNTINMPYGAFAAFLIRKPHIWHLHEFGKEDHHLDFLLGRRLSTSLIDRLSSLVICCSNNLREHYTKYIKSGKLVTVYPAPKLNEQTKLHKIKKENTAVIIGAVKEKKGQLDAVMAFSQLVKEIPSAKLSIIGPQTEPYYGKLKEIIVKHNLQKNIFFVGWTDNASEIMRTANVVLMCSSSEAFGRVTVEAMLLKTPVIGAKSGATEELIKENYNGLFYEPGNYAQLAQKIEYVFKNPNIAHMMGLNGHRWAKKNFSIEKNVAKTLLFLNKIIN